MRGTRFASIALAIVLAQGGAAAADDAELRDRIRALESMVQELSEERGISDRERALQDRVVMLESRLADVEEERSSSALARSSRGPATGDVPWYERLRVSGNADVNWLKGNENSKVPQSRFSIENTRLFFDFDAGERLRLLDTVIADSASVFFEWDVLRNDDLVNGVGQLYVRLDSLGGFEWLNAKFGRFPIPFGEEYLRFHEQRPSNPLISYSAPAIYGVDNGLMLFGSVPDTNIGYVLSVTNGDYDLNQNSDSIPQVTLKLSWEPLDWLHLSASGLRSGGLGPTDDHSFGLSALKVGEFGAYPIIAPAYVDGVLVAKDPSREVDGVIMWETDMVLNRPGVGRLWLSYGEEEFSARSGDLWDRDLVFFVAEGVLEFATISERLEPFYAVVRYSGVGTFDSDRGWRLRVMNNGAGLYYNVEKVERLSFGLGVRLTEGLRLKAEYTTDDFSLVRGAAPTYGPSARGKDYFGVGVSMGF